METKKVILADSSYTIRRITELSFSEEEGIELITLENGFNIKEKLIELKPAVVLVDIKLSGLNGYDICKFIGETESLKDVQVFLMKGGFEPINEGLLKDLKYVDIITKPFDSNELVSSIKDMLDKGSVKAPPIAPEDLPEIDSIEEDEEDISFSDIKDELESDKIISEDMDQEKEEAYMEEVLPSEEITQGPQIEKESPLDANTYDTDEIENPFKEEKAVVKVEKELIETEETEEKSVEEKEEEIVEKEEKVEDFFTISEAEEPSEPVETDGTEEKSVEEKEEEKEFIETEETEEKLVEEKEEEIVEKEEKVEDFFTISEAEEPSEPIETEETEKKLVEEKEEQSVEEKVKDFFAASKTKESSEFDELEEAEEQLKEEKVEEKIEIEEEFEKEEIKIEEKVEKPEPAVEKKGFEYVEEMSQEQKEEIFEKVEDKMTLVIKEILWEIVPSLADKIIKEEISKIKSDMNG